jgi:hypothetical protein
MVIIVGLWFTRRLALLTDHHFRVLMDLNRQSQTFVGKLHGSQENKIFTLTGLSEWIIYEINSVTFDEI